MSQVPNPDEPSAATPERPEEYAPPPYIDSTRHPYPRPSSLPSLGAVSVPPPTSDDLATLGNIDNVKQYLLQQLDHHVKVLRSEFTRGLDETRTSLTENFETLLFTRMHEFASTRYETRMEDLNNAVEALRVELEQFRERLLRTESTRFDSSPNEVPRPEPTTHVGRAREVEPSTSNTQQRNDAELGQGSVTGERIRPNDERINETVREMSRALREINHRLEESQRTRDVPRDEPLTEPVHEEDIVHESKPLPQEEGTTPVQILGPAHPGLVPIRTLQNAFVRAVSYRAYRLEDVSVQIGEQSKVHKRATALRDNFPHITNFTGRHPVKLLSFLQQFKAACDFSGINEGLAVRVISFFLEGDAHRFYMTQTTAALRRRGRYVQELVWPVLVHRLLKRYCSEDALTKAYDKLTRAKQRDNELEAEFADRIHEAAIECGDVFDENTLVNNYVSGLLPTTRYEVSEAILRYGTDVDMSVARRIATAAGETHRAQKAASKPTRGRVANPTTKSTMYLDNEPYVRGVMTPTGEHTPVLMLPSTAAGTSAAPVSVSTSPSSGNHSVVVGSPRGYEVPVKEPPPMNDHDTETALRMMARNTAAGLRCWGCREDGHDLYNCPYIPYATRLLFSKANHSYQAETMGQRATDQHFRIRRSSPSRGRDKPYRGQHTKIVKFQASGNDQRATNRSDGQNSQSHKVLLTKDKEPDDNLQPEVQHIDGESDTSSTSSKN